MIKKCSLIVRKLLTMAMNFEISRESVTLTLELYSDPNVNKGKSKVLLLLGDRKGLFQNFEGDRICSYIVEKIISTYNECKYSKKNRENGHLVNLLKYKWPTTYGQRRIITIHQATTSYSIIIFRLSPIIALTVRYFLDLIKFSLVFHLLLP